MPEKDPTAWSVATWLLIMGMSLLGGITNWYKRVKGGHTRAFNIIELAGELAISGLMGFTGFTVMLHYTGSEGLAAAASGMSAHFATRLLFGVEGMIDTAMKRLNKRLGKL